MRDTFAPQNTTLMPAGPLCSSIHSGPQGHSPFHTLDTATQLPSFTHESYSARAASRRKRAPWFSGPLCGAHTGQIGRMGGHGTLRIRHDRRTQVFGVRQLWGLHSEGLQSWCVHSQHGGFGGALNEQIASTPCNHLRKTKGTNGEGQVRSHAAKA